PSVFLLYLAHRLLAHLSFPTRRSSDLVEERPAGLILQDPLLGERPALDLAENAPHLGAGPVGDDAGAAGEIPELRRVAHRVAHQDRKSTRLNSSHLVISYAVVCFKKKS